MKKRRIFLLTLMFIMLCSTMVHASVNTVFDVPSIDDDLNMENEIYKSPNRNVKAAKSDNSVWTLVMVRVCAVVCGVAVVLVLRKMKK